MVCVVIVRRHRRYTTKERRCLLTCFGGHGGHESHGGHCKGNAGRQRDAGTVCKNRQREVRCDPLTDCGSSKS